MQSANQKHISDLIVMPLFVFVFCEQR